MKTKLPFTVTYTQEMSDKFNKELKESGKCAVTNPKFQGKWDLDEYGTTDYDTMFKKKRTKVND